MFWTATEIATQTKEQRDVDIDTDANMSWHFLVYKKIKKCILGVVIDF